MKNKYKILIVLFICLILVCGCSNEENNTKIVNHSIKNTESTILESEKFSNILNEGNYILLDVRTKEEYNELHITGSINIPYDEIDDNVELDKDKVILVYCKSGKRASVAVETLTNLGYEAYNIGSIDDVNIAETSDK